MIEVIKNLGRKRVECKLCRSVIEYDPVDLRFDSNAGGEYELPYYLKHSMTDKVLFYIHCPVCYNKIYDKGAD